jgi:small subunit ribosomal protein S29
MPAKKKVSTEGPPKKGVRALRIKKKDRVVRDAKPPAPGERKAIRKRIVLSNNNALEVAGLQDLNKQNMVDNGTKGRVLGLPDELVGSLRTVEAFKVGQGWGYFRRPACLIRDEAVDLGRVMEEIERTPEEKDKRVDGSGIKDYSGQTIRKLIHGERGVGKSVLLLQTMAMAFARGWVVINFPEGEFASSFDMSTTYHTTP